MIGADATGDVAGGGGGGEDRGRGRLRRKSLVDEDEGAEEEGRQTLREGGEKKERDLQERREFPGEGSR
eukprot:757011-Hanusia_phi.AAC.1